MRRRDAREIRRGILIARAVARNERLRPELTPFGFRDAPRMPLWEQAYHRERNKRVAPPTPPQSPPGAGIGGWDRFAGQSAADAAHYRDLDADMRELAAAIIAESHCSHLGRDILAVLDAHDADPGQPQPLDVVPCATCGAPATYRLGAPTPAWCDRHGPHADPTALAEAARMDALGYVEQTMYANEDNAASVAWANDEVMSLLADIAERLRTTPNHMIGAE